MYWFNSLLLILLLKVKTIIDDGIIGVGEFLDVSRGTAIVLLIIYVLYLYSQVSTILRRRINVLSREISNFFCSFSC